MENTISSDILDLPRGIRMTIRIKLDRKMAERGMSLKELSEKVGITNVNMSNIKTNKVHSIRFSTLDGICRALDCQPGEILYYDDEPTEDDQAPEVRESA